MNTKAELPKGKEVIEIPDSDDEDTKEQCSVNKDSGREIQDQKPAAKLSTEEAIDNMCKELREVFNKLHDKEKRKICDVFETHGAKRRKISDATHESPPLKDPPMAVVSPSQGEASFDTKEGGSCAECVETELETKQNLVATSDANENSNFEALLKTAGEEQQRLQAAAELDDAKVATMQEEDLVDRSMPDEACEVDGTPQDKDYLTVEVSQDPNCLVVEQATSEVLTPESHSNGESTAELETEAAEYTQETEESNVELEREDPDDGECYMLPEKLEGTEEEDLVENEETETCDSPVNTRVSAMIQRFTDVLPPSFGTFFLFVCGLCCVYVDRTAAVKFALCLLVFSFNVGNAVVETESGDKPVFCVSLPKTPSKSWRALVLSISMVGFFMVINVISTFGEKVANRFQVKTHLA